MAPLSRRSDPQSILPSVCILATQAAGLGRLGHRPQDTQRPVSVLNGPQESNCLNPQSQAGSELVADIQFS